jgi:hypothetical protein
MPAEIVIRCRGVVVRIGSGNVAMGTDGILSRRCGVHR